MLGRDLLLDPNVGTYVDRYYIEHFSANNCQHFEGTGRTLWSVMVTYSALNGFQSVSCE